MQDGNPENDIHIAQWLSELRRLILTLATRSRLLHEMCPMMIDSGEENHKKNLKELAGANQNIEDHYTRLRAMEDESDRRIGCGALLVSEEASNMPVYLATALLIGARLHRGLRSECRSVGEIVALSAGTCPISMLIVRDAFRAPDGVLLGSVHINRECNLDQSSVDLTDAALARVFGRTPTDVESAHVVLGMNEGAPHRISKR